MLKRFSFVIAGAAIVLQACASAPDAGFAHITDPQQIFAAADWTDDLDEAVKSAGMGDRIPEMQARLNEKGGWPEKMKDGDARWYQPSIIRAYAVQEIARLDFHGQPAILLRVPANANDHMPDGWKPANDFYIVASTGAFATPAELPN